jgi:hypothetical protein
MAESVRGGWAREASCRPLKSSWTALIEQEALAVKREREIRTRRTGSEEWDFASLLRLGSRHD